MRAVVVGLYSAAFVCFSASVCGTYAWYWYSSNAGFEFRGTAVGNFGNLQIGIASSIQLSEYEYRSYDLLQPDDTVFDEYGYHIYWSRGGISARTINYISGRQGYATNRLGPVTTGRYSIEEDNFSLHNGCSNGENYVPGLPNYKEERDMVDKSRYTKLIFVFRIGDYIYDENGKLIDDAQGEPNVPIFLTVDNPETEQIDARYALRFYVEDELVNGKTSLIAPMYDEDGTIDVGGPLDLSEDKLYDVYTDGDGEIKEIAYGEYENGPVYKKVSETEFEKVPKEEATTFKANHQEDAWYIDTENSVPCKQEFFGGNKLLGHEIKVATTNEHFHNYAFFNLTIFVEGWDPSVIDQAELTQFNLDLTFSAG